jgi:tryptophanyl-tRNA synthetase
MSKSAPNPKSRILITDSSSTITKKLRVALTDSIEGVTYDPSNRPGVSNLIEIAFNLDGSNHGAVSPAEYAKEFEGLSLKALKDKVADIWHPFVRGLRRLSMVMGRSSKKRRRLVPRRRESQPSQLCRPSDMQSAFESTW